MGCKPANEFVVGLVPLRGCMQAIPDHSEYTPPRCHDGSGLLTGWRSGVLAYLRPESVEQYRRSLQQRPIEIINRSAGLGKSAKRRRTGMVGVQERSSIDGHRRIDRHTPSSLSWMEEKPTRYRRYRRRKSTAAPAMTFGGCRDEVRRHRCRVGTTFQVTFCVPDVLVGTVPIG